MRIVECSVTMLSQLFTVTTLIQGLSLQSVKPSLRLQEIRLSTTNVKVTLPPTPSPGLRKLSVEFFKLIPGDRTFIKAA